MIFSFSNSNMSVICQPRCGHSRLSQFLKSPNNGLDSWKEAPHKIVVLRHPIERIHSAMQNSQGLAGVLIQYDKSEDKPQFLADLCLKNINWGTYVSRMANMPRIAAIESNIFEMHCLPYMHHIQHTDFKYIKFEKLENYFPKYSDHYDPKRTSQIFNITQRKFAFEVFPKNAYFTELELEQEINLYNEFLETKKEISLDEWEKLIK